jgi:hexosaminidase
MKKLNSMVLLAALSVGTATYGQNSIIPKPQKITVQQSVYNFNNISIQSSKAIPEAVYLQKQLKSITGQDYKLSPKANVNFTLLKDAKQKDGYYTLTINDKGINISDTIIKAYFMVYKHFYN